MLMACSCCLHNDRVYVYNNLDFYHDHHVCDQLMVLGIILPVNDLQEKNMRIYKTDNIYNINTIRIVIDDAAFHELLRNS